MPQPVKQPININFQGGLNLKVDPYQVPVGNFLSLVNTVFDKVGRLTKRNGFPEITPLIDNTDSSYLTTFNGDLTAIGTNFEALSLSTNQWVTKGHFHPAKLHTMSLVRNNFTQVQADAAVSPNGSVLTSYTEYDGAAFTVMFVMADAVTGQNIIPPTAVVPTAGTVYPMVSVTLFGNYFIILLTTNIGGTNHIQYIAVNALTGIVSPAVNISSTGTSGTGVFHVGLPVGNNFYIAWSGNTSGTTLMTYLDSTLTLHTTITIDTITSNSLSLAADTTGSSTVIYASYYNAGTPIGKVASFTTALFPVLAPTTWTTTAGILYITSTAINGSVNIIQEFSNNYTYDAAIPTHFLKKTTVTAAGSVGATTIFVRSVGLASRAVLVNGVTYFLAVYQSPIQSTYFLLNLDGQVIARLAYQNASGYKDNPTIPTVQGNSIYMAYLIKDLIEPVSKATAPPTGTSPGGVYSQVGVNLVEFTITTDGLASAETGKNLMVSGGFLWGYDGYLPVENDFFLYPDSVEATWSATGGHIAAQPDGATNAKVYWYQTVYSWTDNQGNAFRSAPSIPIPVTTTGTGIIGSITVNVPTLRLTYKILSPVKIEIYRWSVAQQSYYEVTPIGVPTVSGPVVNDPTVDSIAFVDTLSDASILGNTLLYTSGGVVEDVGGPASNIFALFDDRFWLVDAEDPNLLWFSKQVIESTPVEMSDLFTLFIAPSTGVEGSTGDITALYPMDDKLIIFKRNALYYINGTGPDNTGANNNYSQPIFITTAAGCANTRSIVMTPEGLMFQSNKGIWLLGRDLSTRYIGAPVEDFNSNIVTSALAIPATNQIRFALDNGVTLMFDYFVNQWGEFNGIPSVAGTIFQDLHTIVNSRGFVSQEKPGTYLDGPSPVLMSFTTSWLQLAGLRGYMRAYWFYFLGTFLSPHKLNVSIAYDYNSSATQSNLIAPANYGYPYGSTSDPYYGSDGHTPYGGPTPLENWRIFLERQRCKAFQITIEEVFDPSFHTVAGPGLTLSGLNCIVGVKKPYAPIPSNQQAG